MVYLLYLLTFISFESVNIDHVDGIEFNHYIDENGKKIIDQIIFWEWDYYLNTFVVVDWRQYKLRHPRPRRVEHGEYLIEWMDRDKYRRVYSRIYSETWTRYDPEVMNRKILPPIRRRLLSK